MKPLASSARTRRQQGAADKPTRCASSALVRRASACNSFRIARSNLSSVSMWVYFEQDPFSHYGNEGIESKDLSGLSAYTLHSPRACGLSGVRALLEGLTGLPTRRHSQANRRPTKNERTATRAHPQGAR